MKSFFSRHRIPTEVVSDNGIQYTAEEFQSFAKTYGFIHTTISPRYPQSGGVHEKTVQTVKNILFKCNETKQDPYLALLQYRNTPINGVSPAQALMNRQLNTTLATAPQNLKSETNRQCQVHQSKRETTAETETLPRPISKASTRTT